MANIRKARLANMDIEEVSVVDKAANKRKFLFKKRDDSNETEGGENLELLKRLQKNEKVIKAVEGIDAHLSALDAEIDKLLAKKDLSDDDRKLLKAKKEEFGLMKQDIEEQFEHLFMDKVDAEDSEEESDEETEDEEEVTKEDDEEMTEEESEEEEEKKPIPPKKKPKMRKSDEKEESKEDEDDSDKEESEDSEDKPTVRKQEDSSEAEDDDDDEDDVELDEESEKILQDLNKEAKELQKSNEELKEQLSK